MKNKVLAIVLLVLFCFTFPINHLKAEETNRIISLIPSSTEILFAIGFGNDVTAVSNYCNYPSKEIEGLPRIGDQNLNIEKIISLKPTILVD
ncbi:MAG: ABC transporter substrate-binding protein, partial [Candidatus Riflebacteria bacterium]|nr:ABC transporter substrate-binding protein [Candidatus Riflebacteria bacterium]